MSAALTWFEIPVEDIDRAQKFYEAVLQVNLITPTGSDPIRIFPAHDQAVRGALAHRRQQRSAVDGTAVYLRPTEMSTRPSTVSHLLAASSLLLKCPYPVFLARCSAYEIQKEVRLESIASGSGA